MALLQPLTGIDDITAKRTIPPVTATGTAVPRTPAPAPVTPAVVPSPAPVTPPAFLPGEDLGPGTGYNQGGTTSAPQSYNTSKLEGFDFAKLNNPAHGTTKYAFARVAQKYDPTPAGLAQLMADPEFQKLGMQSVGNGKFRMPDGSIVDAIRGYTNGGYAWQWGVTPSGTLQSQTSATGGSGGAGGGTSGISTGWNGYIPGYGQPAAGNYDIGSLISDWGLTDEFTDPTTANFEGILNARIQELMAGVSDPARQQYADLLQQFITSMSTADPAISDLISSLQGLAGATEQASPFEQMAPTVAQQHMTQDPTYQAAINTYLQKLSGDPYTGAEWEAYRTNALDPIEADRQAARQRALARVSDQGIDQGSGIAQALLQDVDRGFDQSRAGAQNDLAMARVEDRRGRDREIFDIQGALQELLTNRQLTGLGVADDYYGAMTGRMGLNAQTRGTLADILPARSQQQLGAAERLSGLSGSVRSEEEARRSAAIALQGLLAELPERRLQLALATLGQGEAPGSMVNSLLNLAGMNNASQAMSYNQNANTWSGLSSLLGYLQPLWNKQNTAAGNQTTTYGNTGTGYE